MTYSVICYIIVYIFSHAEVYKLKKHVRKKNAAGEKDIAASKSEYYTNLMLITVVEAMVLLIGQLLIYNGFTISEFIMTMRTYIVPIILGLSLLSAAVCIFLLVSKAKKIVWPLLWFSLYLAFLMCLIRYIPNQWSEILNRPICNTERGQIIGAGTSVIFIAAQFIYFSIASHRAEKMRKAKGK